LRCSSSRGPTNCVGSALSGRNCVCKEGYCAFNGKCLKTHGCSTDTPGTCHLLGCSSSRGDVDCISGACVCKPGACSVGGVCTQKCQKETGGTCSVLSCKHSRNADCVSGNCMCRKDDCAWAGTCIPGRDMEEMWTDLAANVSMMMPGRAEIPEDYIGTLPDMVHTYFDALPDHNDPILLSFIGVLFVSSCISLALLSRRRSARVSTEPLLGGAA
jgi:hypothetical protein